MKWAGAYPWTDGHTCHHPKVEFHSGGFEKNEGGFPVNSTDADGGVSDYHNCVVPYGNLNPGIQQDLNAFPYQNKLQDIENLVKSHGYQVYFAGGTYGTPDLSNRNYNTGFLMVHDPSCADFGEEQVTRAWRLMHELAHALTHNDVNSVYGEGKRVGPLGQRTLNEASRAVHWEWLAAHKQRDLSKEIGVHIPDDKFNQHLNTIMHDAVHRAITGQFNDPSQVGFVPHAHFVPLSTAMDLLRDAHQGLQKPAQNPVIISKSENVIFLKHRSLDVADKENMYSLEEVAEKLKKAAEAKIAKMEVELRSLRERELKKTQKAIIPPHKHDTGTTTGSGIEDVPAKVQAPPTKKLVEKKDKEEETSSPEVSHEESSVEFKDCKFEKMGEGLGDSSSAPEQPSPGIDGSIYKEELCKNCGKKHALGKCMAKATLSDSKSDVLDNGVRNDAELPVEAKHVNKPKASDPGSGGIIKKGKTLKALQKGALEAMKKDGLSDSISKLKSSTKVTSAMNTMRSANPGMPKATPKATMQVAKEELAKEHLGFDKLKNKLAHKPGIDNPAAVAASIGRKKYGPKAMAEKAAAAKKAEPPMAKPPSGKNMATAVPASKPSVGKQELEKAGLNPQAKQHGLDVASKQAGSLPHQAPAALPGAAQQAARAQAHTDALAGAFQPKGPIHSGLELASPKKTGVAAKPVQNAARPVASKPGIFGKLLGKK